VLIIVALALVLEVPSLDLDEVYLDGITTSLVHGDHIAWIGARRDGLRPLAELWLFDRPSNRARQVSDGRVSLEISSILLPLGQRLGVLSPTGQLIYEIDWGGHLTATHRLTDLAGYEASFSIYKAIPIGSEIAVTYRDQEATGHVHLATLDTDRQRFSPIEGSRRPTAKGIWLKGGDGWLFLEQENGAVHAFDRSLARVKTLAEEREPHPLIDDPRIAALMRERGSSPNSPLIEGPFVDGSTIRFWSLDYIDGQQNLGRIELRDGRLTQTQTNLMILGGTRERRLVYDRKEGTLSVVVSEP